MSEIFQQFGGMADAAQSYRTLGQDRMTSAEDHLSVVRGLEGGAWSDGSYDDYFVNAQVAVNQTHAHGTDAVSRGSAVDQCMADGQSTLAASKAIAASLHV